MASIGPSRGRQRGDRQTVAISRRRRNVRLHSHAHGPHGRGIQAMKWAAIPPLLGAALTVWTCYAAGALLLARLRVTLRRAEQFPLAFVLGAACVHLALFAIFALKIAYKPVLLIFAIA